MSRQRSRSPRYRMSPPRHEGAGSHSRMPPWNVDLGSHMGSAEMDGIPFERNRHPRDDSGEHWNYFREEARQATKRQTPPFREETRQAGKRRTPPFRETRQPGQQHHPHQEEFSRGTPPSQTREPGYAERRRLSPKQPFHRHEGGDRGRGDSKIFENEERQHQSPQRLPRERFLPNPTAPSHPNHQQQREQPVMNWAREDRGRSKDRAAQSRSHDHGQREGRKGPQGPYKERRRAEPYHERSPAFPNRQRRQMDDALNHGYGKEEEFSSPEKPRDGFGGGDRELRGPQKGFGGGDRELRGPQKVFGGGDRELRGPQKGFSHREDREARPVIVEHDHGITNSGPSQWDRDLDLDGESRPLQKGSLHEQFRMLNRSNAREELRHRPLHDDGGDPGCDRESSRSPMRRDRTSPTGFPDRGGSSNYRGRSTPVPGRGRMNPSWGPRMGTCKNHLPLQQLPQERQGPPQQPQRRENRSAGVGDFYMDSREEHPGWTEEDMEPKIPRGRNHKWNSQQNTNEEDMEPKMPRGREHKWNSQQNTNEEDMEPKMPRGREHKWNSQQNTNEMTVVTEETLTIKVDMSRPVNRNSLLCYSSDRQLSLDLVNVGRQRLDFLPMLEHSGTYRESSMHTGTFAQEIITLVHQVKDVYFGGYGTTLNERFAVLKEAVSPEKEQPVEQLTLNRRFNMNMNQLPEDEPLFSRLGDMHDDSLFSRLGDMQPPRQQQQQQQLVRDPGDLRYDLERRRQERLEGVTVTIPGGSLKQYPLGAGSEQNAEYDDQESSDQGEKGEFSSWSGEEQQERRWRGNMGPRRGGPNRQNSGPQRRNNRPGNRPGQMRWQNNRNNVDGANW